MLGAPRFGRPVGARRCNRLRLDVDPTQACSQSGEGFENALEEQEALALFILHSSGHFHDYNPSPRFQFNLSGWGADVTMHSHTAKLRTQEENKRR